MSSSYFSKNVEKIINKIMTLEALAMLSKVDKSTIHRILKEKHKAPYKSTRLKIADAVKIDLNKMETQDLTEKDLQGISFSPKMNYELFWKNNDPTVINKYRFKLSSLPSQSFTIKIDKEHSSMVMSLDSILEFKSAIAFEDDIIAYELNDNDVEIGKVLRAKKNYYLVQCSKDGSEFKLKHTSVLGILKNLHF
jgi:transcriptional regulator with XRE-family HTH domain